MHTCYTLAAAAGTAFAVATIAEETVRQVASAPKKSKSDRRHISKAMLVSRSFLDKERKKRLAKDEEEKRKRLEREKKKMEQGTRRGVARVRESLPGPESQQVEENCPSFLFPPDTTGLQPEGSNLTVLNRLGTPRRAPLQQMNCNTLI